MVERDDPDERTALLGESHKPAHVLQVYRQHGTVGVRILIHGQGHAQPAKEPDSDV